MVPRDERPRREPTMTQSLTFILASAHGGGRSEGLDEGIMTYVRHFDIEQYCHRPGSSLLSPFTSPSSPSLSPLSPSPLIFTVPIAVPFPECHTAGIIQTGFSHVVTHLEASSVSGFQVKTVEQVNTVLSSTHDHITITTYLQNHHH